VFTRGFALYSCNPRLPDCIDLPYAKSGTIVSWPGLLLRVFHKTKISAARTIPLPTAMPAIAPDPRPVEFLVSLEGEEDEDALGGLEFDVATVVVAGLIFVPVVIGVIVAAPTWLT
jgi:hypothetical protein